MHPENFEQKRMEMISRQLEVFEDIKWFRASAAKEWQVVERGILGHLDHQKQANRSEC